jgi:hypothetical protein
VRCFTGLASGAVAAGIVENPRMRRRLFAALWVAATLPVHSQSVTVTERATAFGAPMLVNPTADIRWNVSAIHYGWFNRLEEYKPANQADVDRVGRDWNEGRAEAFNLVSRLLERLPDGKEDCDGILKLLREAKTRGSARSDYLIGKYYARKECGERDRSLAIPAYREAARRDNALAALELSVFYAEDNARWRDLALAHAYATFAAERMELWPEKLPEPMRPKARELATKLSKAELERSAEALTELQAAARAFRTRLENSVSRRIMATPRAELAPGVSAEFWQADHTGECFDNLVGDCTGVPQTIGVRVFNQTPQHLLCEAHANLPPFAGEALKATTSLLVPPRSQRPVTLGVSQAKIPASGAFRALCNPVTLDANTVCQPKMTGDGRADAFHPGVAGTAVVRGLIPVGAKQPSDTDVLTSSGSPMLDVVAMRVLRSRTFDVPCKDKIAIATVSVAFAAP